MKNMKFLSVFRNTKRRCVQHFQCRVQTTAPSPLCHAVRYWSSLCDAIQSEPCVWVSQQQWILIILIVFFQLSSHQHDCPKAQVSCQFHRYGCTFKVSLRLPLLLHMFPLLSVTIVKWICCILFILYTLNNVYTAYTVFYIHIYISFYSLYSTITECHVIQGLNQDMRQHESTFAAEHLRMMANRNSSLENKVNIATIALGSVFTWVYLTKPYLYLQVEDVKGELLERYKLLPGLSGRLSELENQNDELREKNRQMEQKLATMQVKLILQSKTIHFYNI